MPFTFMAPDSYRRLVTSRVEHQPLPSMAHRNPHPPAPDISAHRPAPTPLRATPTRRMCHIALETLPVALCQSQLRAKTVEDQAERVANGISKDSEPTLALGGGHKATGVVDIGVTACVAPRLTL